MPTTDYAESWTKLHTLRQLALRNFFVEHLKIKKNNNFFLGIYYAIYKKESPLFGSQFPSTYWLPTLPH